MWVLNIEENSENFLTGREEHCYLRFSDFLKSLFTKKTIVFAIFL